MIRLLSLFLLLLFVFETSGQTAKKYVFTERFTNTFCTSCPSQNTVFFDIVENHEDDMHHLTVHPAIPSAMCPFYLDNTNDNTVRKNFHDVSETPIVLLSGEENMGTAIITDEAIKQNLNKRTSLGVEVDATITGIELRGNVKVYTTGNVPTGNLRLMIAAVEEEINFSANNGESRHYDVLRELSRPDGVSFTPADSGSFLSFGFDFKSEFNWDINQMYILAWVEDRNTREVINSGSQFDPPVNLVPSSVSDLETNPFTLSPNPASDFLSINLEQPLTGHIKILNIEGKQISSTYTSSTLSKSLDISNLVKGIYVLKIETDKGITTQRFVKQ